MKININDLKPEAKRGKVFFESKEGKIKIIHDDFLTTNLIEKTQLI